MIRREEAALAALSSQDSSQLSCPCLGAGDAPASASSCDGLADWTAAAHSAPGALPAAFQNSKARL